MRKFWAGLILVAVVGSLLTVLVIGSRDKPDVRHGKGRIAVVRIEGVISSGMGAPLFGSGVTGSEGIARRLEGLAADPSVDAVILRLDSPGGTVAAGQEIAAAVDHLRGGGKVAVASMGIRPLRPHTGLRPGATPLWPRRPRQPAASGSSFRRRIWRACMKSWAWIWRRLKAGRLKIWVPRTGP